MKLALAHDHIIQIGGGERVLFELARLFPAAPIYTLLANRRSKLLREQNLLTSYLQRLPGALRFFKYYLPLMPGAWETFNFSDFDVVLSSSSAFVKGLIAPPGTIHITYCHSPTRYLWSDNASYIESLRVPFPVKSYLRLLTSRLRVWDKIAAQRVDYFIANSRNVADRIMKFYQRESTVIYPPVAVEQFSVAAQPESYFLVISRLRPYKRVDLAIRAFNALRLPLVIIGEGEERHKLQSLAKPNIRFLGEVND